MTGTFLKMNFALQKFITGKCICAYRPQLKNKMPTHLLTKTFVLIMILLAGKEQSRCLELDEKRGLARRWEQLFLSKQVKKINRLSTLMILSLIYHHYFCSLRNYVRCMLLILYIISKEIRRFQFDLKFDFVISQVIFTLWVHFFLEPDK